MVAVQWNIYMLYGTHICSVIYAKYLYSDIESGHLVVILGRDSKIDTVEVCLDRTHLSQWSYTEAWREFFK